MRRKNAALQMQQFVGEEKNDLLDYLRSLQPEKVCVKITDSWGQCWFHFQISLTI